ncbi:Aste57867_3270 [Aphanomyces stellatus]|uniref:Aste57867_3270 protein n=1 Tax=Aphanomyces stellatus TaxID=120398 RepID=A0A485KF39_9STRA|nr:hypothetical protein As57867_003260 [Aphanomyces stellatus]VFT80442.1 Aste57867_3270 [Aphanomyces stellatus]
MTLHRSTLFFLLLFTAIHAALRGESLRHHTITHAPRPQLRAGDILTQRDIDTPDLLPVFLDSVDPSKTTQGTLSGPMPRQRSVPSRKNFWSYTMDPGFYPALWQWIFKQPHAYTESERPVSINSTIAVPPTEVARLAFLHALGMINLVVFVCSLMWFPAAWLSVYVMNESGRFANYQVAQMVTTAAFYLSLFVAGLLPFSHAGIGVSLAAAAVPILCLLFFFRLNRRLFPPSVSSDPAARRLLQRQTRRRRRRVTFAAAAA